jgi:hypothetical protein
MRLKRNKLVVKYYTYKGIFGLSDILYKAKFKTSLQLVSVLYFDPYSPLRWCKAGKTLDGLISITEDTAKIRYPTAFI